MLLNKNTAAIKSVHIFKEVWQGCYRAITKAMYRMSLVYLTNGTLGPSQKILLEGSKKIPLKSPGAENKISGSKV
ncbi:MAG: hypothetical protein ABR88_05125 [Cryomorphaceae bacterium BACL7 MAG-120322-bin74]|nr:MAG: hypothetical protein ABR88_05125 [Cryomorphaceae bacterium BACL7 MAG-120322-bin74]